MAVGTNTLGLLFKIGVDPGDAKKVIDSFWQGLGQGAVQGAKDVEKGLKQAESGLEKLGTTINQTRAGLENAFRGDALEGVIQLTRALGPLGIAIGGVAVAAAGVAFAIKGAIDAASQIGTTSKDDFDALQKKVQSAGQSISELQRAMAGGVLDALDKISGATTAFFAKILEKDGKALILLLNNIANFITGTLIPLVDRFAGDIEDAIVNLVAAAKSLPAIKQAIDEESKRGLVANLKDTFKFIQTGELGEADKAILDIYKKTVEGVRKELEATHPAAKALTAEHTKATKAVKDLTEAQLELNRAQRAVTEAQQQAAVAIAEINRDQAKGIITFEEGAKRRIAVTQEVLKAERAALDEREKAAQALPERKRQDELEKIAAERAALRLQEAKQQEDETNKIVDQNQKLHDALAAHFAKLKEQWLDYAGFIHKTTDEIVKDLARQAQPVPGGGGVGPIPGAPPPIPLPVPTKAIKDLNDLLAQLHKQMVQNIDDAIQAGGAWGGFTQSLKEFFSLKNIGDQFVLMMQSVLDVFIQTGHTGPAVLRQLVAGVLRAIATMSAEWGTFFLLMAVGFAALGDWSDAAKFALAGAGLWALAAGLGFAASKVGPSQAGAAAGAGGFGGTSADGTPSPVNIALGGGGATSLAISNAQFARAQIDAINNLNNKLASMSPGDVVTVAADQKPEAFATGTLEAGRRNGAFTREFMQISGARS